MKVFLKVLLYDIIYDQCSQSLQLLTLDICFGLSVPSMFHFGGTSLPLDGSRFHNKEEFVCITLTCYTAWDLFLCLFSEMKTHQALKRLHWNMLAL